MKCPNPFCRETLATHSRRLYCKKCRSSMGHYDKLRPAERLQRTEKYERAVFRITHIEERSVDQLEAVSQARRTKKAKFKAARGARHEATSRGRKTNKPRPQEKPERAHI